MNERSPNLDDLVRAHREGVRLESDRRGQVRARLLSRVAAGIAASTTVAGTAGGAAGAAGHLGWTLFAKVGIGLAVVSAAGAAYEVHRSAKPIENAAFTHSADPSDSNSRRERDVAGADTTAGSQAPASPSESTSEPASSPVDAREAKRAAISNRPAAKASSTLPSSLAGDVQLMHDVEEALAAGQPERALQLLDGRRATRAAGPLDAERAAARIVTLCRLGRGHEARADAASFLRNWPRSPLVERVRSTCPKTNEAAPAIEPK